MKERNALKPLIGILCVLILIVAVVVALILDSRSPDPILGIFQPKPTTSSEETAGTAPATEPSEEQLMPPDKLPPSVTLPMEEDPQTGGSAVVAFPYRIPEYDLVIEKMAPYSGLFVENGANQTRNDVAMLLVHNDSKLPVEFAQIRIQYAQEELLFDLSALPAGEKLVVQEKNGKAIPNENASSATAMVVQRPDMQMSENQVQVTDNGDNTLTVRNLTGQTIPTVRVFYKYRMSEEDIFVGGISFTVRITNLGAGASVTIQPSHYTSQTSRVVMVLTYDSEV